MDIENNSTETNVMLVGAFVSLLGAFTYCIKKAASNGIAFRSNCCKGAVEVDLDTNEGRSNSTGTCRQTCNESGLV
jgi:hypothetical protein|tara:strand:- start:1085 stop:1312 length:228 start_codon:yes stop_codon:yes gene_type:complete